MVEVETPSFNERKRTKSSPTTKLQGRSQSTTITTATATATLSSSASPSLPTLSSNSEPSDKEAVINMPLATTSSTPHAAVSGPATRTRTRAKQSASTSTINPSGSPNLKHATASSSKAGIAHLALPPTSRQRSHKADHAVLSDSQADGGSGPDSAVASGSGRSTPKARMSRAPKKSVGAVELGSRGHAGLTDPSTSADVFQVTSTSDSAGPSTGISKAAAVDLASPTNIPGMIDLSRLRGANATADQTVPPKKQRRPKQHARTKSEPMVTMVSANGVVDGGVTELGGGDREQLEGEGKRPRRLKAPAVGAGADPKRTKVTRDAADEVVEGMQGLRIGAKGRGKARDKVVGLAPPKVDMGRQGNGRVADDEDEDDEDEVDEILIGSFGGGGMEVDREAGHEVGKEEPQAKRTPTSTPRKKSRGKSSGLTNTPARVYEDATTGDSSAGEAAMPIAHSVSKRSSAVATSTGTSGRGFQTDGEVTAARYGGHLQGRFDSLDENQLSRSVPSAFMGGFLSRFGDSGEDSPGGGNGSRTARTARERDREVHVETVEDLEALEDAEQWEMPGLEDRGSGQDLTWQQSLFSSPGAMLPRVGGASGMAKAKRDKGIKGSGAKYPSSDLEGQQDSPRQTHSDKRSQYNKGYSSTADGEGHAHGKRSFDGEETRDNFYPLPAIPPYRDNSSYNTPKRPVSATSRKRTAADEASTRPGFSHHTVSAPAIPAFGASGKKNKQVEALIGMYAGPTFHNSPSPDALPAPRLRGH